MTSEESHRERERTFRYRHNSQHVFLFADTHTRAVDVGTCWVSSVEWGGDGVRENDGRVLQLFVSPAGANNVRVPLQPEAAGWVVPCHPVEAAFVLCGCVPSGEIGLSAAAVLSSDFFAKFQAPANRVA